MKKYIFKAYDSTGGFLSTISDVSDDPQFTSYINSGLGQLTFRLPRSVFRFEENTVIAQNNKIKVVCYDGDAPNGTDVYSGYISKYIPTLEKGREYVDVTCLGYATELERFMAEDASGNTTLDYNSEDPTDIFKDVLDKYTGAGGSVDYSVSSTEDTSSTVSYEFNTYTVKEALDKCVELSPNGWYFFVGSDDVVTFKEKNDTADHVFTLGKDVVSIIPEKSVENLTNRIYFTGGDDASGNVIFRKYERSGSISTYGLYSKKIIDKRVTDTDTMEIMATAVLDREDTPETRTVLEILDNNNDHNRGYDIESINPGDTCKIIGYDEQPTNLWDEAIWGVDKWDYDITQVSSTVQQIMKVSYSPNSVILELSSRRPEITNRIEDIKRNLDRVSTNDNPSSPTV